MFSLVLCGFDSTLKNVQEIIFPVTFLKTYSEPTQTTQMVCFAKTVSGFQSFTIFAKSSILDV